MIRLTLALIVLIGTVQVSTAQCVYCAPELVAVESAHVEYVEETRVVPRVVRTVQYVEASWIQPVYIPWDYDCFVTWLGNYRDCRESGGGVVPCAIDSVVGYAGCAGPVRKLVKRRQAKKANTAARTVGWVVR